MAERGGARAGLSSASTDLKSGRNKKVTTQIGQLFPKAEGLKRYFMYYRNNHRHHPNLIL
jgi:hypothetical protein